MVTLDRIDMEIKIQETVEGTTTLQHSRWALSQDTVKEAVTLGHSQWDSHIITSQMSKYIRTQWNRML